MKFLIVGILLLATQLIVAQDYVIDVNDRKLYGTVILGPPAINSSMIKFKNNETGTVSKYRPDEIKCWVSGDLIYESKVYAINEHKGFSVFMLRLSTDKGKVKVYEYYNTNGEMGYTQTFLEKDGGMTEVNYARFRKHMATYFKDNKELAQKITDKKYKKKDLLQIVEEYNNWREFQWQN